MIDRLNGMNYAQLLSGTTNTAASLLSTLYNAVPASTAASTGNPITDLKLAQSNRVASIAREAKLPLVARDITAFQTGIGQATGIQGALSNPNVMKVLLTANNLGRYLQYPALARKALLSDPADPKSLVNRLGDAALLSAAKTYDFAHNGLAALNNPKVMAAIGNGYAEIQWRQSLNAATPGLTNALTFLGQAKSIASVDAILGDPANRAVVLTALGIPAQIAFQSLTAQEHAVSSRVDIKNFQKPAFVTGLADQYLLTMQRQAADNTGSGFSALGAGSGGLLV